VHKALAHRPEMLKNFLPFYASATAIQRLGGINKQVSQT
jgi:hypothetical protein